MKELTLREKQANILNQAFDETKQAKIAYEHALHRQNTIMALICDEHGIEDIKMARIEGNKLLYEVNKKAK